MKLMRNRFRYRKCERLASGTNENIKKSTIPSDVRVKVKVHKFHFCVKIRRKLLLEEYLQQTTTYPAST